MGAKVFILPQILATEHFSAPGQSLLTISYRDSGTVSIQVWVWLPASSQQSMWSATWPHHDKSGATGWTGHCSLLHNPFQATSKPPISQVTKKSFWQCLSFAPLSFLPTCPSETVSLSSSTANHTECTEVSFHFCSNHQELQSLSRPER